MAALARVWTDRLGSRERSAILLAGSAILHAAMLGPMAFWMLKSDALPRPAAPPIFIEIEPRILMPGEQARRAVPVPLQSQTPTVDAVEDRTDAAAPASSSNLDAAAATPLPRPQSAQAPGAPNPRIAANAPPQAAAAQSDAVEGAWRVSPSNAQADAVGGSLRGGPIGCRANYFTMTPEQKKVCDDRAQTWADRHGPISGSGNARRDARFAAEGAREMQSYEMQRRPLSGGVGVVGPADCVGSNFGIGCAGAHMPSVPGVDMQQGGRSTVNQGERRPQGLSLNLGGLRIGGQDED